MASKQNGTRNAAGAGSIRKKAVTRGGKEYIYWEARYTAGYAPGTGKQVQRSITGKTQRDVAQKLREITAELDSGTYQEPSKMTVGSSLFLFRGCFTPLCISHRSAQNFKLKK